MSASRVFETRSVSAAQHYMSGIFRSHDLSVSPSRASLQMRHEAIRSGRASLHWLKYGAPVSMSAPEMNRFYLFQFVLAGACEIRHRGQSAAVRKAHSYVVDPSGPLAKTWDRDCEQLIVKVDRHLFEGFASRELGIDVNGRFNFDFDVLPVAAGPRCIIEIANTIRSDARLALNCLSHTRVSGHLDVAMMALLLASFPHRYRDVYDRSSQACAPHYVHRAENYIRAHLRDAISIDDLVAVTNVSVRSLFNGFRQFRNQTPMGYLKALRLDLARDELMSAHPYEMSVTAVALSCGFTHMSKFSQDFTVRFGERPSALLGRQHICR